ncbi:YkgJ family cysteine cluster protein [Geobacter benzoatilyticus]|uniref:YkgJ family cysteine cluster protein n=1 Tax=Geobacter benzoatilyticus TaxID=2815309 RepID=A0ABX7Q4I5_9BACT|nr:YkgJ family cysteine cluster protein [Geobacter benzoatilyticus]QSV45968.1 YkgJ family cysteine cluster protein [Geobacter benzoatilyticus]
MTATGNTPPFDFSAYCGDIADLATQGLAVATGEEGIRSLMGRVTGRAEEVLSSRMSLKDRGLIACGPGCAACCTINVTVLLPEAIAIARYVTGAGNGLSHLKQRIADTASRVRWMDDGERISAGIPCAFLDERGWCVIHPVRPLTCRALSSTDSQQCRRALASHGSCEEEMIVVNIFQKFLMEETFRALSMALERAGLDISSRELCRSVTRCIQDPHLSDDFLAGNRIRFPD